jgi:hypothetical protein
MRKKKLNYSSLKYFDKKVARGLGRPRAKRLGKSKKKK